MFSLGILAAPAAADRIWWDGSRDDGAGPPGKLLSDNEGYWGDCVLTGVEYEYEDEPTNPADVWRNDAKRYGRRLLDGRPSGNWWVPVGVNHKPLVVTFDFKRPCTFQEVDLCARSKQVATKIEVGEANAGPWQVAHQRARDKCPDKTFHRIVLEAPAKGRHLRLTVQASGITWLSEVLVWGDAQESAEHPEAYRPVAETPVIEGTAFASLPGIAKTAFPDKAFWEWRRQIGPSAAQPAVWSRVSTWGRISDRPILPLSPTVNQPVGLVMARNETECVAFALTNTTETKSVTLPVALSEFFRADAQAEPAGAEKVSGALRVAGTIPSRHYGVNVGPLLAADNMPGASLMRRYLTNAAGVVVFPNVTLAPAGSAVVWVSVTTADAAPGKYRGMLRCKDGAEIPVIVTVVDVTLPAPRVWLHTWSGTTSMFPFRYGDRQQREVAYKRSLGVTVWNGWPQPGSDAAQARQYGHTIHHLYGLPRKYIDGGYSGRIKPKDLAAEDEKAIADHVGEMVAKAKSLGLGYDDWYAELWDEPGPGNSAIYGALAALVRKADPSVRIYANPCFWIGGGVAEDDVVLGALGPWYKRHVDVSVPLFLLLRDRPESFPLFDHPRAIRASYWVCTQSAKSQRSAEVELYRDMAWQTFARGWNGWGFYSYYGPRGNPWNDFDQAMYTKEDRPDYLMVYPGPRGPIPTRQSEAVREGWEDYRLLTLLKQQGKADELEDILEAHRAKMPLSELRARALRAAAKP